MPSCRAAAQRRRYRRDTDEVSDREYGPYEPPITITDFEWRLLEVIRIGRTVTEAAAELKMPPFRLRFLLANLGEKLAIASKL